LGVVTEVYIISKFPQFWLIRIPATLYKVLRAKMGVMPRRSSCTKNSLSPLRVLPCCLINVFGSFISSQNKLAII